MPHVLVVSDINAISRPVRTLVSVREPLYPQRLKQVSVTVAGTKVTASPRQEK